MSARDPPWLQQLKLFITQDAPAQCAEFLDRRPDVAAELKAFRFDGALRMSAFAFIALVINSPIYTQWAALLFPVRAPHFTPSAVQLLPASERLFIVKACLGAIDVAQGVQAVAHLISYTRDFTWYVHRGAVPDGKRSWRLWRLVTHHRHLLNIAKNDHWHIIRALLATCPEPFLPAGDNAILSKADELAIRVVLNSPTAELVPIAVELARKINPLKATVAHITPSGPHAHLGFDRLRSAQKTLKHQGSAFTFSGRAADLNVAFVRKVIKLDNENGTLLMPPEDLMWNRISFRSYADRVALFSSVAEGSKTVYRVTKGETGDAYRFCLCALVGLYELHGATLPSIKRFFELSKQVRIGCSRPDSVWRMLWSSNHKIKCKPGKRKKCFGLLIGPRTHNGGLFNPHMPLFNRADMYNLFCWFHDTVAAFASSPFSRIVGHLSTTGSTYSNETKARIRMFHSFVVKLHTEHPDIGPNDGAYARTRLFSKAVHRAMYATAATNDVKAYLRHWFLPNVRALPDIHLKHRLPNSTRAQIRTFVLALRRTAATKKVPFLPGEILSIILSLFL